MKGIILAGGYGTRLFPITKAISKQLLPLYDKPMVYYPLSCLMLAGISDVLIICSQQDLNSFISLFGSGEWLGMKIEYAVQEEPKGIAEAFIIGEKFIGVDNVALVLGDNFFYGQSFTSFLKKACSKVEAQNGAVIYGYYTTNPSAYGVVEIDNDNCVVSIEEKPKKPKSNYAIPGLYFYDNSVIEKARLLTPSKRNELEITDINNLYLTEGKLAVEILGRGMTWLDSGSYDGLLEASNFVATVQKRQGLYISCIEEIAYNNQWISKDQLLNLAAGYNTEYGRYLETICHLK